MALRRHTCTACCIHIDGHFRKCCLEQQALEITQISVQSPTSVILPISSSSWRARRSAARSVEPKVSLSMGSVFLKASNSFRICQPSVPRMQWGTGRFFPSCVSRYQVSWVSLVKKTSPSKFRILSSTLGTMATASFVPSAPSIKIHSACLTMIKICFIALSPFFSILAVQWSA